MARRTLLGDQGGKGLVTAVAGIAVKGNNPADFARRNTDVPRPPAKPGLHDAFVGGCVEDPVRNEAPIPPPLQTGNRIKTRAGALDQPAPAARWSPGNGNAAEKPANVAVAPGKEGTMARPDFPLNIDRRRLLTSAAATVTATGILPGVKLADAAAADVIQCSPLTLEAQPRNFCAATARRLIEIARRNEIRREANLPLLSIAKELRRMKQQEELETFSRFEAAYGKAVWDEVLKPRREAEGPNWRPSWIEGMCYQNQVFKIARQQFQVERRVVC